MSNEEDEVELFDKFLGQPDDKGKTNDREKEILKLAESHLKKINEDPSFGVQTLDAAVKSQSTAITNVVSKVEKLLQQMKAANENFVAETRQLREKAEQAITRERKKNANEKTGALEMIKELTDLLTKNEEIMASNGAAIEKNTNALNKISDTIDEDATSRTKKRGRTEASAAGEFVIGQSFKPGKRMGAKLGEYLTPVTLYKYMRAWREKMGLPEVKEFFPTTVGYIPFFYSQGGLVHVPGGISISEINNGLEWKYKKAGCMQPFSNRLQEEIYKPANENRAATINEIARHTVEMSQLSERLRTLLNAV